MCWNHLPQHPPTFWAEGMVNKPRTFSGGLIDKKTIGVIGGITDSGGGWIRTMDGVARGFWCFRVVLVFLRKIHPCPQIKQP